MLSGVVNLLKASVTDLEPSAWTQIQLHILKYLDDIKLDMKKVQGIGTDGASTMLGCRNGVVAQLKRIRPSAVGVHCAAHRLNLASR